MFIYLQDEEKEKNMVYAFKEYLQSFLTRYGIDHSNIDFDSVCNYLDLQNQLNGQTSEDINLSCALNLIFDLHGEGVCLYHKEYRLAKAYAVRKDEWVYDGKKGVFSIENYIERFLIDDVVKCTIYESESKYAMGNPYRLTDSECTIKSVAEEIAKRKENRNNNGNSEEDGIYDEVENIRKNLYRPSGIIGRLKRDLSFYIERFNYSQYKVEICKIIYYIYEMENDKIPGLRGSKRFDLPKFLMQSTKNLAKYSDPVQGNYGWRVQRYKIMRLIGDTLEKELDIQRTDKIRSAIDDVTKEWDKLNSWALSSMEKCALFGEPLLEIERIEERMNLVSNKLDGFGDINYSASPIEVLYFLVCQHQNLCEIEDNIKVCDMLSKMTYKILASPNYNFGCNTTTSDLYHSDILLDDVEDFIDDEADLLAVCIYTESSEDWNNRIRNIRGRKKEVRKLLGFLADEMPLYNEISILHILVCLQFLLMEEISAGNVKKQKRHKASGVLLDSNEHILSPDKMYWMKLVNDHIYPNIGRIDVGSKYNSFLLMCYNIRRKIYSAKNIAEMQHTYQAYYDELTDALFGSI